MPKPHVLMLLASAIDYDTRVKKEAVSLAASGCMVTVVARSADGEQSMTDLHGVRVIRQPVELALHQTTVIRQSGRSADWRPSNRWRRGLNDQQAIRYANSRTALAQREVASLEGRLTDLGLNQSYRRLASSRKGASTTALRVALKLRWPMALLSRAWPSVVLARFRTRMWERRLTRLTSGAEAPPIASRRGHWPDVLPYLVDTEIAFGQYFDRFPPNVIHCHDFFTLPMAVHARERAFLHGKNPKIVYDSHELVTGLGAHYAKEIFESYVEIERAYVRRADAIVTVTEELADRLVGEYDLPRRPVVVKNAPPLAARSVTTGKTVRKSLGLDPGTPIGVYIGSVNPNRGIDVLIAALPKMPDLHVAIAATRMNAGLESELLDLAGEAGVAGQIHFVDPVDPHEVVAFISDADVGLIVSRNDVVNHQVSLPNKLFEYLHAGLPIVTSNCDALEHFVKGSGVGEVFLSEDSDDLARALDEVLGRVDEYRSRITDDLLRENSWESSQVGLIRLYSQLLQRDLDENPDHPLLLTEVPWR